MAQHLSQCSIFANLTFSSVRAVLLPGFRSVAKGKGLDTCYSSTYMSHTRDQQRFTI